ncbi:EAL domain-containing protein [Fervidibacillus halotolerans]|uniref:EAL domain-containing protein n=1 Tax=Fervidibacillus halotolerans TaxID=2980027 RepID=A0A9E8M044_9BACI|nr:EAL domain-containing protein [Fervidibacillus halotolerans]WAA12741.1 EAL domain-containing protein [Fervidibacillus halotolerans]
MKNRLSLHMNKSEQKTAGMTILVFLTTTFLFIFFQQHLFVYDENHFLVFHILLELASIVISFTIAMQSWIFFPYSRLKNDINIFIAFFSIAILDLFHMMTYKGMPGLVLVDSSANLATWFWITARLTQSIFLLVFVAGQNKETANQRKKPFIFSLLYVTLVSGILMIFHEHLPTLVVDGEGTTTLKKGLEILIVFIIALSIFRLHFHYKRERTSSTLDIILALVFLLNSELIFSSYTSVYDSINMLGHLYKIIGYVYFMRGIYVANIKTPFHALFETRSALRKRENQIQAITDSLGEGIFVLDKNRKLVFINPEGERLLGYKKHELIGKEIHDLIHVHGENNEHIMDPEECPIHRCLKVKTTVRTDDDIFIRKDGYKMPVSYTATPLIENNEIIGSVVAFQNIEKQKQYVKKIKQQAYYDMLTGLPNRRYFLEKLDEEVNKANVTEQFAVLYLDLDNFKNINDSFGHVVGDRLLREIGKRLNSIHTDLFVSHHSGDEFALFIKGNKEKVETVAKKIIEVINRPFSIDSLEIFTSASIGISMFPYDGLDGTKLLQVSDIALFEAKKKGKNRYLFYSDELEQRRIRNAWIEQHLYAAISNGEISVHYQPIVDLRTKEISGLEALARWKHPKSGFIPPSEFIQVAENNGLIIPIGSQVMETAAQDLKQLHEKGFQHLYISINLSLKQLKHSDFIKRIISLPEIYGLKPEHFQFEITETVALFEDSDLIRTIKKLKEQQFRIAIDDFGKGFSSIGYLKQITVDTIKIDKSYVFDLCKDKEIAKLTNAIIAMANFLQLKIIAEGVELSEHVNFLNKYQNVLGQGYYFSRPIPFDQITTYLQKHSKSMKSDWG